MNASESSTSSRSGGRRAFLKKAAVGGVLASLPAKSVWADGVLLSGSIIASSHASSWAGTNTIGLRSAGFWKQEHHASTVDRNSRYFDIFGGAAIGTFDAQVTVLRGGEATQINLADVTLFDILHNPGSSSGKKGSDLTGLGGPGNVNFHMIAMFLNAVHHGMHSIYYPVISLYGGPYLNEFDYAHFLYGKALIDMTAGDTLSSIISMYHV